MSRKKKDRGRDGSNGAAASKQGVAATLVFRSFGELANATPSPGGSAPPLIPSAAPEDGHHERANADMVRKAIKDGWNVSQERKDAIVTQAFEMAATSPKERTQIAAMKILLQADKTDVDRLKLSAPQQVNVSHSGGIDHTHQLREQMLQDPDYLAYLEQRAADEDSIDVTPQPDKSNKPD